MDRLALPSQIDFILITGITPYFLEKGLVWFQENEEKILNARKIQPFFQENTEYIQKGQKYPLSQLLRRLDELGYEKVFRVQDPGEFAQRGGVVEVFPINSSNALRLEFVGNRIEQIEKLNITVADATKTGEILKKKLKSQRLFSDLRGLKKGDYLVHLDHGVARFAGFTDISHSKYYVLEYAAGDRLFVPFGLERKLSRYIGFTEPRISRLGSLFWIKTKRKVKEEVEKLARDLLELYAKKEVASRPPYLARSELEEEVAAGFAYQETPDQLQALKDINEDMSGNIPMDRIVCGDVGFGKTEIALRTMIKAVENGYQAVILAPTTILAYQHFKNFQERLENFPVKLALLSRLQTKKEQEEILTKIKKGAVDIIIGTHRLLSSDVEFKNLGLLVIDDEHKFGVKQKEKLRQLRASIDVLSLSATPIPRTLYMALSSLRNISLIQTPPEGRVPVQTKIAKFNEGIIKDAIYKELSRNGQVYYLYNRIGTIELVAKSLEKLVPEAKTIIAHGRLKEKELMRIMDEFRTKKYNVLVATTIIESGLDLPNVNTLIVADATRLGLAQAYQIRGRIGRSQRKAYAYFLYPSRLSERAKMRLKALREATDLGAGWRIALKDLEIRGAGNILGREQSGNVNAVGLNLYCQMLSEAVEKLKS